MTDTVQDHPTDTDVEMNVDKVETIQYVGDRNAILFKAATGEPIPPVELPDEFFKLNADDVRLLYKELKENREDSENQPLRTRAHRELEEGAAALRHIQLYSKTVIRVQFPDRLVLQAVFNHSDSIQTVVDFVRGFLDSSDVLFYLYTAPPKSKLRPTETLIDSKLTPRALVYFGVEGNKDRMTFLNASLMNCLTSIQLASEAAFQFQNIVPEKSITQEEHPSSETPSSSTIAEQELNMPSTSKKAYADASSSKVPKWFKR